MNTSIKMEVCLSGIRALIGALMIILKEDRTHSIEDCSSSALGAFYETSLSTDRPINGIFNAGYCHKCEIGSFSDCILSDTSVTLAYALWLPSNLKIA